MQQQPANPITLSYIHTIFSVRNIKTYLYFAYKFSIHRISIHHPHTLDITIFSRKWQVFVCVTMQSTGTDDDGFFLSEGTNALDVIRCHLYLDSRASPPQLILKPNTSGEVKEKNGKNVKKKNYFGFDCRYTKCIMLYNII